MSVSATARATISSPGRKGSNAINELGARYAMITAELAYDESGQLTVSNDYRKFGLVLNPIAAGTAVILYNSLFATMTTNLTLTGVSGSYGADDTVVGQTSGAVGIIVDFASGTGVLRVVPVSGTFVVSEIVKDSTTAATGQIASFTLPQVQKNTGSILYTEDIEAVSRASTQIESIKITIPF